MVPWYSLVKEPDLLREKTGAKIGCIAHPTNLATPHLKRDLFYSI
jgi:hypothetical protein